MVAKYFSFLFFFLSSFHLLAQGLYKVKLEGFVNGQQQEKVYLHFDKPHYASGDDIWLKAYVTNATSHLPTAISNTLYVELINQEKAIVDSLTLFIYEGVTHGNFTLKRDIKPGSYRVRAYTEWMRNYGEEFFYRKDFLIVNPTFIDSLANTDSQRNQEKLLIDFLPEGGDFIEGIATKLAIRITDIHGNGVQADGTIINDEGEAVTNFQSSELGYALCLFMPDSTHSYHALVSKDTFHLPPVKNTGVSVRITHSHQSDNMLISVQSKNVDLNDGTLVAHRRGQLILNEKCSNKSSFNLKLKKSLLKEGIIHITFFDKNQLPLSERLVFPNPPKKEPDIAITSDRTVYKKRTKVTLELRSESDTVHSASITINPQNESDYEEYGENIKNYLLLTSDLKGKIASPDFYFTGTKEAYNALDLLMLTHGWSRFNWTSLLRDNDSFPKHLPESGLKISGKVSNLYSDKDSKKPLYVGITIPSVGILNETSKTKEDGTFQIGGIRLADSASIYLQALREKGGKLKKYQSAKIVLDTPNRPTVTMLNSEFEVNSAFLDKIRKLDQISRAYFLDDQATMLEEIVISTTSAKQDEMDKRTMYSEPSNRLILDSLDFVIASQSVFDLLLFIPGVTVEGLYPDQTVTIRGNPASYLLDGRPIDLDIIQTIAIQDVEFIDVLKGPEAGIYGSDGSGGAVLIYTRRGKIYEYEKKPTGLLAITHPGYHKAKEFYSPQYDIEKEEHIVPDFRTTLHWDPELKFEDMSAEATFFTSDQTGSFVVRLEGMTADGKPFFEESVISVE